ncbi:hypothetical protein SEA_BRUHMOMENT_8 [Arthrobacter phage BruhMoment]|nr:hypothetical protein SEA_BRUHMOMENT_8 [Arthrobacter phage BruhMoment]
MARAVCKFRKLPEKVEAAEYDGTKEGLDFITGWVREAGGVAFGAEELLWRHDMGTYWHPEHRFVYLPQGARGAGSPITSLRDDELVVRTSSNTYALVFPGDYVVRSRSGFYPRSAESFHRSHVPNRRRGTNTTPALPAAV